MALTEATPRRRNVTAIGPKFPVTLAGTCIAGDVLGESTGYKRARATTGTAIQGRLIALEAGVSGDVIECCAEAVIGGFTGATIGGAVYVEQGAGVGGGYTETAPSDTGDCDTIQGYALSATEIHVRPGMRADSLSA